MKGSDDSASNLGKKGFSFFFGCKSSEDEEGQRVGGKKRVCDREKQKERNIWATEGYGLEDQAVFSQSLGRKS